MRLLILSDLHLEVWRQLAPAIPVQAVRPDVVILAGDIERPARVMAWAAQQFAGLPVIYVSGNHEAYGDTWESAMQILASTAPADVHVLDRGEVIVQGVRFLGTTLWTDYALFGTHQRAAAMAAAEPVMLDYRRIQLAQDGPRALTPQDTIALHQRDRDWLAARLQTRFDGRTVVVSHMAPSMRSVAPRYASDLVSAAFASNLDELAAQADLWVHGHTHDSFDYRIGRCRVVCNPCGYLTRSGSPENASFNPGLVVEL